MIHITDTASHTISTSSPRGIRINFNLATTGTVTVADGIGTQAIITNPTIATPAWEAYGFQGTVTVTSSATTDLTVSVLNNKG